jgi:hypothetical protein
MPIVLKNVHAIRVRNFKYTPEPVINNNNNTFQYTFSNSTTSGQGSITLLKGDYNQDIGSLMNAANAYLNQYDVQFTLDAPTNLVQLVFSQPSGTQMFEIPYCGLLKLFGYQSGIALYRAGTALPPITAAYTPYAGTAPATALYKAVNDTDLILRINSIEAIFSTDSVCHRATAVLMSNRSINGFAYYQQELPYPLLQVQHRVQQLRVSILNSDGDPYDLYDEDASFMIEFHTYPE